MEPEYVYLTHLTLHTREKKQTTNFSKVADKGRMYIPLPSAIRTSNGGTATAPVTITLPDDLKVRVERGEVVIMVPADGLNVYAGDDVHETIKKLERKDRNVLIHRSRDRVWRDQKTGMV
jgi:hypothetical protein